MNRCKTVYTDAAVRRCSSKLAFFKQAFSYEFCEILRTPFFQNTSERLLLKVAPTQVFSCECCNFFKNSFFYRTLPMAAFMSSRKGGRGKSGAKER